MRRPKLMSAMSVVALLTMGVPVVGIVTATATFAAVPMCKGKRATIIGTNRSEQIRGTSRSDVIVGLDGADKIFGNSGADVICGGKGNDVILGGIGADTIAGGPGNDRSTGGPHADKEFGDAGADVFLQGVSPEGPDRIIGGTGRDTVTYASRGSVAAASIAAPDGSDGVTASDDGLANDGGRCGSEHDAVDAENLVGTPFNDVLQGDDGANALTGLEGDDNLIGEGGNDTLNGGTGSDVYLTGPGANTTDAAGGETVCEGPTAGCDTTPPELVSLTLDPTSVDTSGGPQTITGSAHITDDLTGLWSGYIRFSTPAGPHQMMLGDAGWEQEPVASINSYSGAVSGPSPLDCTFSFELTVPQYGAGSEPGTWVTNVEMEDKARQWVAVPTPATFEQTAPPNAAAPSLVEFSFPAEIDSSETRWVKDAIGEWRWTYRCAGFMMSEQCDALMLEQRTIPFTARIVSNGSPFEIGVASFGGSNEWPIPSFITAADRVSGTAYDGIYESSVLAPEAQEQGDYLIDEIVLFNAAGNGRWLHAADLAATGLPNSIHDVACQSEYVHLCVNYPTPLGSTPGPFAQITVGQQHTCALTPLPEGNAVCWGRNAEGQAPPAGVTGPFTQIAAGVYHTCALTLGEDMACWGLEGTTDWDHGQAAAFTAGPFTQISTSGNHTCALTPAGDAACWGFNGSGQAPPEGVSGSFTEIAVAGNHTCALTSAGDIVCWGSEGTSGQDYGQAPAFTAGPFTQFALSHHHTCGLTSAGDVRCWGANSVGQAPPTMDGPFTQISAHGDHTCGLTPAGDVTCRGNDNVYGQSPASTAGPFTQFISGGQHTCALSPEGDAPCWGLNNFEQVGILRLTTYSARPVLPMP